VGNPPFIGNKRMREALGDGYVQALRGAWPEIPESADFVMFWWHHAAAQVAAGHTRRMGLITTNSLTMVFNRRVVQAALDKGCHLHMAIPDHPWVDSANGAAVRIAMTVLAADASEGLVLTVTDERPGEHGEITVALTETTGLVHADLTVGANVAAAKKLAANAGLSVNGMMRAGEGFLVTTAQAEALGLSKTPGLNKHILDFRNGRDLTDAPRGVKVIDAFGLTAEQLREQFPAVYQWLLERVKPDRDQNNRARLREQWWVFAEPRKTLRAALKNLERYIATVETTKHRVFQFLPTSVLPEHKLVAIALDDAFSLGILSSQLHVCWALATGGTLEDRPVYSKSTCFDTFPFPDEDTGLTPQLRERIAHLAEQIDQHRKRVLGLAPASPADPSPPTPLPQGERGVTATPSACTSGTTPSPLAGEGRGEGAPAQPPGLTLTGLYNVLAALREGRALTAKEKTIHTQGLVGVLRELHDELDTSVLAAYGLPADAGTDDILAHLVQLNTQRAAEEAQGRVRWLRPAFQNPQNLLQKQELLPQEDQAPEADFDSEKSLSKQEQLTPPQQPWPAQLPDQVRAVAAVLAASPAPLQLPAIEARFKGRGPWKKGLPTLLQTLEALGRAQAVQIDGVAAWRRP
ncbi:MAG: class I SAM-dependent DNA methyltransferase, partial [Burkholderiaceae bacterium]|nr:class I SAM-dependent DNA methyltransferase [Burkholderiaceae bacterium]